MDQTGGGKAQNVARTGPDAAPNNLILRRFEIQQQMSAPP